jgi:hypothetical protein
MIRKQHGKITLFIFVLWDIVILFFNNNQRLKYINIYRLLILL